MAEVDMLTEIRFWSQVIGDAKRIILCSPELESRVKSWIDARGMGGVLTVKASRGCPDDRIFIIDQGAMAATMAKFALGRPGRWEEL
ncbi:MAG: hypothetical protein ACRD0W_24445 [Acidimicrobiales bacterium]